MKKKEKDPKENNAQNPPVQADTSAEQTADEKKKEREKKRKKIRRKRAMRFWDRLAGFIIVTVLVVGCACLGLEYIILKGPSPALRSMFISTMEETRRFRFIPLIFMTKEELAGEMAAQPVETELATKRELITVAAKEETKSDDHTDAYGLVDEDGDGIIFLEVKGNGYMGYMTVILDPTRVFVGKPDEYGGIGLTLEQMVQKYDAMGGINAGGFKDDGGGGLGGQPEGLTIVDGVAYSKDSISTEGFAGLDRNGILHVGFYSYEECVANDIVHAVSFGPILISNGEPVEPPSSSVNPRTAIGQRADGAIIMLVVDGRQVHSIGATYQDMMDIMLDYGAVNAINMDGGSSTVMYYKGRYVNSCSAEYGQPRPLPDAWLYK
ncbi:MAG: phosphodiester glycosidase family protein [Oscillospiraceae bacterium]|nr:phosphodiester glycosidase family protein [Oscillospiraceae bacterium]